MPRVRAWFSRLFGLFQKNRRNAEMNEEIQAHVDLLTERNIAAGMRPDEARHAALRQFGGGEDRHPCCYHSAFIPSGPRGVDSTTSHRSGVIMVFRCSSVSNITGATCA